MISNAIKKLLWKACLLKDALFKQRLYAELNGIATSLEGDIFIKLQADGIREASVEITETALKIHQGAVKRPLAEYSIPASKEAIGFFKGLGISKIEMDAILESNQIMDILRDIYAMRKETSILTDGYKAYCAVTRFFPDSALLSIKYSYCELDYSKAVRGIKEKSRFRDHRVFFRKAPRYGITTGLAVIMLGLLYPCLPKQLSIALSILAGIAAGLITFIALQTMGSLEYDKEYLEKRLQEKKK
ncbi:MAG: hypothetical protein HZB80_06710 [Deltaproteobacteria bacterium]|nr:hypothetical protein [Deltaproteobacteria bacterium]